MDDTEEEQSGFESIGAVTRRIVDGLSRLPADQVEKWDGPTARIDDGWKSTQQRSALATSAGRGLALMVWGFIGRRPA